LSLFPASFQLRIELTSPWLARFLFRGPLFLLTRARTRGARFTGVDDDAPNQVRDYVLSLTIWNAPVIEELRAWVN
jgi:hypothetical protein